MGHDFANWERQLLDSVDEYLQRGLDLRRWWNDTPQRGFEQRFELATTFNRPDSSFGFFDRTSVAGREMPIMGNFQQMLYDHPKSPHDFDQQAARWMQQQMRQFVLRYFMRVSDFRRPETFVEPNRRPPPRFLEPLSMCSRDDPSRIGFGFQQLFYKRADNGAIGRFGEAEQGAIVDLRDIGPRFEWIVVKVKIFDFAFALSPLGSAGPRLSLPLDEDSYLVISRDFVLDGDDPCEDELGHYGLGYAFIKNPSSGLVAYGPGEFATAIELIDFHVLRSGQVKVTMVFVADRPARLVNFSLDPIDWGMRLADTVSAGMASEIAAPLLEAAEQLPHRHLSADPIYAAIGWINLMSAGWAGRRLCIERQQLEKIFLLKHFQQHYQTVAGSLQTWRQVPDWLDTPRLPQWVVEGGSA